MKALSYSSFLNLAEPILYKAFNFDGWVLAVVFHVSLLTSYVASNNIILCKIRVAQIMRFCFLQK